MVMATDMEEDGAMEGVEESEGEVDEFDLAELRREFAGQTEGGEDGSRESDSGDDGEGFRDDRKRRSRRSPSV